MAQTTVSIDLVANISKYISGLDKAATGMRDFAGKVKKSIGEMSKDLEQSKFVFAGVAGAVTAAGAAFLISAGKMEQWRISFTTMLGSAEKSEVLLKKINQFAAKTPFELPQVVEGTKRLLAYGIEAEKVLDNMKILGDITAGVGQDKLPQLILAFGQVKAATRLMGQELRQFTEAGVPLIAALADHFGVAESKVKDMVSAGQVGFSDVEQALRNLTTGTGKFANLMEKQSLSLVGIISNIKDGFIRLSIAMGEEMLPAAKLVAAAIRDTIGRFTDLQPQTKQLILIIGGLTAAFTGLLAVMGTLVAFAPQIAAAWAVVTGPVGWLAAAITGVIALIVAWKTNFLDIKDIGEEVLDVLKREFLTVLRVVTDAFPIVGDAVRILVSSVSSSGKWILSFVRDVFDKILSAVKSTFGWIIDKLNISLQNSFGDTWETLSESAMTSFDAVGSGFSKLSSNVKNLLVSAKNDFMGTAAGAKEEAEDVASAVVNEARGATTKVKGFMEQLRDRMKSDTKDWSTVFVDVAVNIRDKFASSMADMIVDGGKFKDKMKQIGKDILKYFIEEVIKQMVAKWIAGTATMSAASAGLSAAGGAGAGMGAGAGAGAGLTGGQTAMIGSAIAYLGYTAVEANKESLSRQIGQNFGSLGGAHGEQIDPATLQYKSALSTRFAQVTGAEFVKVGEAESWLSQHPEEQENVNNYARYLKETNYGSSTGVFNPSMEYVNSYISEHPGAGLAEGGIVKEPALFITKSGKTGFMGEAGPEAIVPLKDSGYPSGVTMNVYISGEFLEANPSKWRKMFKETILPEVRREVMTGPKGNFIRRRGQT